ncbi:MAG TPA: glycine--tRNA ligase [Candidatus Binatia bacterium]|jgi:glycyl-tRNA synthetase|nr:glycine--tRNA ligase [Candidatus Binatia bacterium]
MPTPTGPALMERLVSLCKRRGFIFQSSEIYGGINGFWDYGPLGVELKNNLRDAWWDVMVRNPPLGPDGREIDIVGLDCSIISHPKVWEASGHVGGFADPMQTCRQCKRLFRADHVEDLLAESEWVAALLAVCEAGTNPGTYTAPHAELKRWAETKGRKVAPGLLLVRKPADVLGSLTGDAFDVPTLLRLLSSDAASAEGILPPCPHCGGDLTEPRQFNLMFETYTGAVRDEDAKAYLRPETAQGMFYNFKNVIDSTRVKIPFGICQVGRSFRNEVTPRNFIFRSREFEQMELEFFVHPSEADKWYQYWRQQRFDWWCSLGLAGKNLRLRDHEQDELAHYAKESGGCCDVEYAFPFSGEKGFTELEGIAYRSNYDLTQHQKFSGVKLDYFDQERNERYLPHVIEPAAGLTRGLLAVLCESYTVDESRPSPELMRFHPRLAPIKAGVFPLVNKEGMPEIAEKIFRDLRKNVGPCQFDAKQSIGKRYARMDEAGTPFCITVDGQSVTDQTVTVRDRDTGAQIRVAADQIVQYVGERVR